MSLGTAIPIFCVSVAASLVASLVFARKLDEVSERLGASEGLRGILTALGADAPEISTALAALAASHGKLGVGVVIGSNVAVTLTYVRRGLHRVDGAAIILLYVAFAAVIAIR